MICSGWPANAWPCWAETAHQKNSELNVDSMGYCAGVLSTERTARAVGS